MEHTQHHPPYHRRNAEIVASDGEIIALCVYDDETGDNLTRAANCHDELVEALEGLYREIDPYDQAITMPAFKAFSKARAILAKAKATP